MENAIAYDVSEDLKGMQWTGTLLLAENEQQQLIMWSATAQLLPQDVCVPQFVELQAAATPDTVVVVMDNQQANRLARNLRSCSAS
jgi:non-ribosomal peptide synthetase component F